MRSWLVLLSISLAGCRCEPVMTAPAESELRVSPSALDFGPVAVGATYTLPVVFSNAGRAPLSVSIAASGEFSSSEAELTLAGGEARTVDFTFTPSREGPARLELEGFTLVLDGVGLPRCEASTCRASTFDLSSRTCVETRLDDGAACQSACLSSAGTCFDGDCVGAATTSCDDGNACTIDGCRSDGGCLHAPASAPTRNACEVPVCDPQRGFVYQSVDDGTLCGTPTCSIAKVCLNGACTERPTANAPGDCRYTAVCSSAGFTCASTRSGRMRCWGDPDLLGRDGGSSLPAFLPGATDAQKPVCVQFKPRWLDSARHLQPDNPLAAAGLSEFVDVRTDTFMLTNGQNSLRALTPEGVYVRSFNGSVVSFRLDGGVERLCGVEFFIRDGGALFDNYNPEVQLFTKPVRSCGFPINPAFAFEDGTATKRSGEELVDGGVTLVGTGNGPTLFLGAETRVVFPRPVHPGPRWPFAPVQVTEERGSLCGVSAAGELACMAAIDGTRLSPRVDLPIEVGDGGFTWIRAGNSLVMRGAVVVIDRPGRAFATDGQFLLRNIPAGGSTLNPISPAFPEAITSLSTQCIVHGSTMSCVHEDGGITHVPDVVVTSDTPYESSGVTTRGELVDDEGRVLTTDVLPGSTRGCQGRTDGGITCGAAPAIAAPGPFRRDTIVGGGGCVVTAQFEAWCFSSGVPQRMALPFGVRLVSGNLDRGCAVIGNNGVRCWGLGSRFRNVAFDAKLTQISVAAVEPIACALTEAGRVFCWGDNPLGGLGIAPYDNSFIVPLE